MKRRKYNYLKERATDLIGDNDEIVAKAKNSKGIPLDFPEGYPEDAYFAYLDAFCNGNPDYWDDSAFMHRYIGTSDSPEDFIAEYYSEMIDDYFVSYDYSLFKDEIFLSKGADLDEIGRFVYRSPVGDAVWEALNPRDDEDLETAKSKFIGDDDDIDYDYEDTEEEKKENLESEPFIGEKNNFVFRRMVELFSTTIPYDDEYSSYAKAYIMAVSEYEDISYIRVVLDLQEKNPDKEFIDWGALADYLFDGLSGDFVFENGFVFYQ